MSFENRDLLFNKCMEIITRTNSDKKNINNSDYIEKLWLKENEHISNLGSQVKAIYMYLHNEKTGYTFKNDLMTHILEEIRYTIPSDSVFMKYFYKKNGWDFDIYIYTHEYIYYSNGIKNEKEKYFNIIPNIE